MLLDRHGPCRNRGGIRASLPIGLSSSCDGRFEQSCHSDPDVLFGTACFSGTRVPVTVLMDYLRAGERIDDFLEDFPTVSREQIGAVLTIAGEAVTQNARSA